MISSKAVFNDFLKGTEPNSAVICRLSEELGEDDLIICYIQHGRIEYGSSTDKERFQACYALKDGKVVLTTTDSLEQETTL